jgi:hypothetical protein
MFRLQWSHLQAKCLRIKIVSGIPSDLRELVRDPFRLYIGCLFYKNWIIDGYEVARGARWGGFFWCVNECSLPAFRSYGCVAAILGAELVGVLCVLSPVVVMNSEDRTNSVVLILN